MSARTYDHPRRITQRPDGRLRLADGGHARAPFRRWMIAGTDIKLVVLAANSGWVALGDSAPAMDWLAGCHCEVRGYTYRRQLLDALSAEHAIRPIPSSTARIDHPLRRRPDGSWSTDDGVWRAFRAAGRPGWQLHISAPHRRPEPPGTPGDDTFVSLRACQDRVGCPFALTVAERDWLTRPGSPLPEPVLQQLLDAA